MAEGEKSGISGCKTVVNMSRVMSLDGGRDLKYARFYKFIDLSAGEKERLRR